ncbi:MAG: nitronate monooxygenase [Bacteroidia bacterium]|nr:MAG: nitronate monooxygenase [Bacteroidia bacterium]
MNKICQLFQIKYPVIKGGMVWCSGWKLASAVSNAGGLGLIGAGSMHPDTFREHIQKCKQNTFGPFGVNIPLLYPQVDELMEIIAEEQVKIVFTSAGSPKKWTKFLKDKGITVVHVVSSALFAQKSEAAGVDAVVAEGFEAGGHNGREETTTMVLIPKVTQSVKIPVIAAGGIATGEAMAAAMMLGAEGVQIGSAFAVAKESSAHPLFKNKVIAAGEGDTRLALKSLAPVRLLRNPFAEQVFEAERQGKDKEFLSELLGKGRAKKGMFEGDMENGELEIGQVASLIESERSAAQIMEEIIAGYKNCLQSIPGDKFSF